MLDVIYADEYGREQGILEWASGDFVIGRKNNFELKVPSNLGIKQDYLLMIDGSEYGGIVDGIEVDTTKDYITTTGRTWHGILETSVVIPDEDESHIVVSGECNTIMQWFIDRQGMGNLFAASEADSGFYVEAYVFLDSTGERHADLYTGFRRMLTSVGGRLAIAYDGGLRKAVLSTVPVGNYVDDGMDGDRVDFSMAVKRPYNHLIALGSGELQDRLVRHVYADKDGNVSLTQTIFGAAHKAEVYNNPNCDSAEELIDYAKQSLANYQKELKTCKLVGEQESNYEIDDIVGAVSTEHDMRIVTRIAQKIATLYRNDMTFETRTELED